MSYHHKYSITELEELIPFERDVIVEMTSNYIAEQEAKNKLING